MLPGDPRLDREVRAENKRLGQRRRHVVIAVTVVIVAFLAWAVLSVATAPVASARSPQPSPEPPPWFGGRVEMVEHGFAVTLPEDWVALDTGADADAQVEALEARFPGQQVNELAGLREVIVDLGAQGFQLFASEYSERITEYGEEPPVCVFVVLPDLARRLDEGFVNLLHQTYLDQDSTTDVEPPTPVDLPVGPGWAFAMTGQSMYDPGYWNPATLYVAASDRDGFLVSCTASERPHDDWLSIAETFEFLPAGG